MKHESILLLENDSDFENILYQSIDILKRGGVVLTPTDTVYGLLCLPQSEDAIKRIYAMKSRPFSTRLPIIVADRFQAEKELPLDWINAAIILTDRFWPGALTVACGIKQNEIRWLRNRDEAAIRAPKHPLIQALARELGPMLMTSANSHGQNTPHTVDGAILSLAEKPDLAIDGGELCGAPSTLVNVNLPFPIIERDGAISKHAIMEVLNELN